MIEKVTVDRGARWLDQNKPLWFRNIDRPIDLYSVQTCVLGQVYGCFQFALNEIHHGPFWGMTHGFFGARKTEREWEKLIAERKDRWNKQMDLWVEHDREYRAQRRAEKDTDLALSGD